MKNPLIQFKNFTFKYRAQKEPTIKDINLTIYEGEKVLIVGPSGSGKSTLAHCINGLVPFSYKGDISGSLTVKGQSPNKAGIFEMSKIVGTVLQDSDGQFIGLTVAEDIAFSLENECVPNKAMEEKVIESAKLVGVENLLSHSPQALSGGQKQRVALAGVMTMPIDILLFDEPLANLDPATGKYAIELIDDIHKHSNTTVLIIEHRLEDVLHRNVDRVIVMDQGLIIADLTPDELLSTSILNKVGIREPLYITAMKYAGCEILATDFPSHIDSINLTSHKEKVQNWFSTISSSDNEINSNILLEIENLSFHYNNTESDVLKNISFSIKKGEMISIVGRNGAGKSTLSKLICGFEHPTNGAIRYEGEDILNDSIKKRAERIGMVMQNPNQMISKPMIFDEVALGLVARGISVEETRKRVEETLKICGLYPFRNWPVSALSFGQKKRVTIASILVLNPQVLILDEPTAGQDFRHYTEIMEFLKEINQKYGITIIMITHDMHLMLEYTNRAIVISDGTLVADKSSAQVLTDETIVEDASLKMTSLYDLSKRCEIENPTVFVENFINYDREVRK